MPPRASPPRDDETVRTILDRARRRARAVTERIRGAPIGARPPAPGPVDRVDPKSLEKIRAAPKEVERDDTFEQGLAATVRSR